MAQANYQNLGKRAPGKISGTVNSFPYSSFVEAFNPAARNAR
jgi:hypothetical protein